MDFIIDFPLANGKDSNFVVVDRLIKMAHFIPYNKIVTGEEIAKLFLDNIYRIHGLLNDIVSDRESQFISNFWRRFFQLLGVKINHSTMYHPQSDGQIERVNQILEQYLHCTLNYQQDDWMNTMYSSTNQTPFFSSYGHHLPADPFQVKDVGNPVVEDLAVHLTAIYDEFVFQLYEAQDRYKDYVDRIQKIHPNFYIGN